MQIMATYFIHIIENWECINTAGKYNSLLLTVQYETSKCNISICFSIVRSLKFSYIKILECQISRYKSTRYQKLTATDNFDINYLVYCIIVALPHDILR